jgi:uncharacterized protein YjiS (DUF1127 family)
MHVALPHTMTDCQAYDRRRTAGSVTGWMSRTIGLWRTRARERRAFTMLEDRDLRDAGISRWEVERELAKPFWRG